MYSICQVFGVKSLLQSSSLSSNLLWSIIHVFVHSLPSLPSLPPLPPSLSYYLYQWPLTMSVIVVVSIFITLCTCTLVMWIRDVLRDYDAQRRRRRTLQRRQATAGAVVGDTQQPPQQHHQQQQQQQQGGGRGGLPRGHIVMPRPPHSATVGSTDLPPYPRDEGDRTTPTPSELSVSTAAGIEDLTTSSQLGEI